MDAVLLHKYVRDSLQYFRSHKESEAFRLRLECAASEGLLTDLLFITLHRAGRRVSREPTVEGRRAADLCLHDSKELFIEAKQLHLKDGCRFAPENLKSDLVRHGRARTLGVLYMLDERESRSVSVVPRYRGANRKAKHTVASVLQDLPKYFQRVYPRSDEKALLREFKGEGRLRVYAVIVQR